MNGGNLFQEKVPGAVFVGNAFGKLIGSTPVNELREIETPVLLTSTLSVGRVADASIGYMLKLPGDENVKSVIPLVGETNDGYLNDIRARRPPRPPERGLFNNSRLVLDRAASAHAGLGEFTNCLRIPDTTWRRTRNN